MTESGVQSDEGERASGFYDSLADLRPRLSYRAPADGKGVPAPSLACAVCTPCERSCSRKSDLGLRAEVRATVASSQHVSTSHALVTCKLHVRSEQRPGSEGRGPRSEQLSLPPSM